MAGRHRSTPPAWEGAVDPAYLSHIHARDDSDEGGGWDGEASPVRQQDTLDLSRASAAAPLSTPGLLRLVLATYNAHATCSLQATRGLKHYIAKLEELVASKGVPAAWEEELALASENAGSVLRAFLASRAKCSYTLRELGVETPTDAGDDIAASTHILAAMHDVADELTREHQRTISEQEQSIHDLQSQLETERARVQAAREEADEARAAAQASHHEAAVSRADTAAAQAAAATAEKATARARAEAQEAHEEVLAAQRKLGSDSASREMAAKKVAELATKLRGLQADIKEAKAEAARETAARNESELALATCRAELAAAREKASELQAALAAEKEATAAATKRAEGLDEQRQELAQALSAAKVEVQAAQGRASAAEAAVAVWEESRKPWEGTTKHQPGMRSVQGGNSPSPGKGTETAIVPTEATKAALAPMPGVSPPRTHEGYSRDAAVIADLRMRLAESTRRALELQGQLDVSTSRSARHLQDLERQVDVLATSKAAPSPTSHSEQGSVDSDGARGRPTGGSPPAHESATKPAGAPSHAAFTPPPPSARPAPPNSTQSRSPQHHFMLPSPHQQHRQREHSPNQGGDSVPRVAGYNPAQGYVRPALRHPYAGQGAPLRPEAAPWSASWGPNLSTEARPPAQQSGSGGATPQSTAAAFAADAAVRSRQNQAREAVQSWHPTTRSPPKPTQAPPSSLQLHAPPPARHSAADSPAKPREVALAIRDASAAIAEVRAKLGPVKPHATHAMHE